MGERLRRRTGCAGNSATPSVRLGAVRFNDLWPAGRPLSRRLDRCVQRRTLSAQGQVRPPFHGSSRVQSVYGGAQPGTLLASGFFTGESTRNPRAPARLRFRLIFRGLRNQRSGKGGSRLESTESTRRNPGTAEATPGSRLRLGAQKALIQRQKTV